MSSSSSGGAGKAKKTKGTKRELSKPSSDVDDENAVDEGDDTDTTTTSQKDQPELKKRKQDTSSSTKGPVVKTSGGDDEEDDDEPPPTPIGNEDDEEDEEDEEDDDKSPPTPIVASSAATLGTTTAVNANGSLTIVHIDVGQGESTLIIYRESDTVVYSALIDGGRQNNLMRIKDTLAAYHVNELDHVISTHFDADHIEGLTALLSVAGDDDLKSHKYLKPDGKIYYRGLPRYLLEDQIFSKFRTAAGNKEEAAPGAPKASGKKKYTAGEFKNRGSFKFECLYRSEARSIGNSDDSENNAGVMMTLTYGAFRYFTAGDQGADNEHTYAPENCAAFKCGHHGSKHSTKNTLLKRLRPAVAIISAAKHKYRHPHHEVLENLRDSPHVKRVFLTNCAYNRPQVNTAYLATEIVLAKTHLDKLAAYVNRKKAKRYLDTAQYGKYIKLLTRSLASITEGSGKSGADVKATKLLEGAIAAAEILKKESERPATSSSHGASAASSSSNSSAVVGTGSLQKFSAHVAGNPTHLGNIEIFVDSTHYSVGHIGTDGANKWCHFKIGTNEVVDQPPGWNRTVPSVTRPGSPSYTLPFSEFSGYSAPDNVQPCWVDGCEEPGSPLIGGSEGCNKRGCAEHQQELRDGCKERPCVCRGEKEESDDDDDDDVDEYRPNRRQKGASSIAASRKPSTRSQMKKKATTTSTAPPADNDE
ncbi:ComEC/Rec2 family competence protein [Duganella vulcania]|uniref:Metallo-beta-lactamase domain-containing protein n=1 Tax=Duganella vulcania TaxID=2692166 RepID=A0A845GSS7_9BURK|nr:MBL fold metallo-hydrolase [Duganella vulcania]MYM96258.1 hypothetical protein [Duganella vulcania]